MNKTTDQALTAWLLEGPETGPRESLERALAATRRTSQRPGWTFLERWLPMQLTMSRAPVARPFLFLALVALLVFALVAGLLIAGSQRRVPPPFGPAANGAIAYEQNGDLLIADGLGGTARTLVSGPESDSYPVFSHQGDRVAFVREANAPGTPPRFLVMSSRPDGTDVRQLASLPGGLDRMTWSPDGSQLLVGHSETDYTGLKVAVVNADGSGAHGLDVGMTADYASWRPDGSQIVFRGHDIAGGTSSAFIVDSEGRNPRRLDIETTQDVDFEGLAWSPDGRHLSFMSAGSLGGADGPPGWQIGIADIDQQGLVTDLRRMRFDKESFDEMHAAWSPDSTYLAFQMEKEGVNQVAIANADGTGLRMVGPRTVDRNGLGYAWAPDGRTLLIASRQGETTMWSIDAATGAATALQGPLTRIPAWQRLAS